jgi:Mg-chelatase subunit ChlD
MSTEIPLAFICPITLAIMDDPYSDIDGNTYEKDAIINWVRLHNNSPITRNPMRVEDLVPNRALRTLIDEYNNVSSVKAVPLHVETPKVLERNPITLILIADTSGSMQEVCDNSNSAEKMNFTRLDLVKHTLKTVTESLCEHDYLGLVEFNTSASALTRISPLNKVNKDTLNRKIDSLKADGGTNIWDALRVSVEMAKTCKSNNTVHLLLFTDGESNNDPPRGIIETLTKYLADTPDLNITIGTYGFGNNINSKLLYEISRIKGGMFSFIPDSTMIGTVFVNSLAHLMTVKNRKETNKINDQLQNVIKARFSSDNIDNQLTNLRNCLNRFNNDEFANSVLNDCSETNDDNDGQIEKAMSSRYFNKWGKHYLYSVLSAYKNSLCLNFKDKGVQHFKTPDFEREQAFIENIFINMTPPVPSGRSYDNYGGYGSNNNNPISSAVFTATFYNRQGGCFLQDTRVKTIKSSGEFLYYPVQEIKPGDQLVTPSGIAIVKCVLKLKYSGTISRLNKTALTSYHPIYFKDEKWFFPAECDKFTEEYVENVYVYDYILDKHHVVELGDIFATTLIHGRSGDVIGHSYFGTNKFQNDLMHHPGWVTGYIQLDEYDFIRDSSNKVVGIEF